MSHQYYFSPGGNQYSNEVIARYLCQRSGDPDPCTSINKMCGDKIPRDMFPIDEETVGEIKRFMAKDSRFTGELMVDKEDGNGIVPLDFEPAATPVQTPAPVLVTAESPNGWRPFVADRRAEVARQRYADPGPHFVVSQLNLRFS